ncbi:MAG: hypothetical protein GFH27_549283n39 [Chloroflexi bacterium AL-W]|nr:hypothetical protein [Chloroflexi bacterium AL-N10]NOK76611.1 hypothetical protein [Chloroflexi bacterium AL-N5]NOK80160.1 hypothetical protein [Chloroflexi bacterium AL-W]NOK86673.1 hypothetical protein [Chloroflexi bacterium AL-N15]
MGRWGGEASEHIRRGGLQPPYHLVLQEWKAIERRSGGFWAHLSLSKAGHDEAMGRGTTEQ